MLSRSQDLTAAASKDFCIATDLVKDIAGYIARTPIYFLRFQTLHFHSPFAKTNFYSCGGASSKFYMWVLGRPSRIVQEVVNHDPADSCIRCRCRRRRRLVVVVVMNVSQ